MKIKFLVNLVYISTFILYKLGSASIPITLDAFPTEACIGCEISFSVNSPCSLTNATFYWSFGDGSTSITDVPYTSHTYNSSGAFNVNVMVVKSRDSGSANKIINIYKLGRFEIDAERIYDIEGKPLWFHIHVWKTILKDTNGNDWNPVSTCLHVLYEWWNCWDNEYFPSGHSSEYTFQSIFRWAFPDATGVKAIVYCECNYCCNLLSEVVTIYLSQKVQE
ncbi:MAG: PKD domain-containing protein [Candidatus Ratteibacteria bacterium]